MFRLSSKLNQLFSKLSSNLRIFFFECEFDKKERVLFRMPDSYPALNRRPTPAENRTGHESLSTCALYCLAMPALRAFVVLCLGVGVK